MSDLDPLHLAPEGLGEDETSRPQPADDATTTLPSAELIEMMQRTIQLMAKDGTSQGDLKILSRTLRELRYAFKVFQPFRGRRKVTIFGSARTPADDPAFQQAVLLGRTMAHHGWMVITGAGGGIMEAGHQGAGREWSMGLNIMLPFEQSSNSIIHGDAKLVTLKYFFTRKLMFVKECSALVCLPGGFGTLDETMEVLTLIQTGKQTMLPVILLDAPGGSYWSDLNKFIQRHLLEGGMISPEDQHLYIVSNSVTETVDEILNFYRVYHSMRFVGERLVLRMIQVLTEAQVAQLNEQFQDILVSGTIDQVDAYPEESSEPTFLHLPRLSLHFNRRAYGRLRQLLNAINSFAIEPE